MKFCDVELDIFQLQRDGVFTLLKPLHNAVSLCAPNYVAEEFEMIGAEQTENLP